MKVNVAAALLILLAHVYTFAGSRSPDRVITTVDTAAGTVTIVETEDASKHVAMLNGDFTLYQAETYGVEGAGLKIAKLFRAVTPSEDVLILSESDGGIQCRATYVLIPLRADGVTSGVKGFGNCATPTFIQQGAKITINFPRMPQSPAETWIYANGNLSQAKAGRRRR